MDPPSSSSAPWYTYILVMLILSVVPHAKNPRTQTEGKRKADSSVPATTIAKGTRVAASAELATTTAPQSPPRKKLKTTSFPPAPPPPLPMTQSPASPIASLRSPSPSPPRASQEEAQGPKGPSVHTVSSTRGVLKTAQAPTPEDLPRNQRIGTFSRHFDKKENWH
jgi:type IV secretory pathway VirB10-like protein